MCLRSFSSLQYADLRSTSENLRLQRSNSALRVLNFRRIQLLVREFTEFEALRILCIHNSVQKKKHGASSTSSLWNRRYFQKHVFLFPICFVQTTMKKCFGFGFCFFGIGRKPTHDFLSLYTHSTAQQDPRPSSQGNFFFLIFKYSKK